MRKCLFAFHTLNNEFKIFVYFTFRSNFFASNFWCDLVGEFETRVWICASPLTLNAWTSQDTSQIHRQKWATIKSYTHRLQGCYQNKFYTVSCVTPLNAQCNRQNESFSMVWAAQSSILYYFFFCSFVRLKNGHKEWLHALKSIETKRQQLHQHELMCLCADERRGKFNIFFIQKWMNRTWSFGTKETKYGWI